ncbi:MAG TPA: amino acid deaminase/aldolase [Solirubrobacteraceae bacterium]|jgi:D-serine deaminase-like pyridoxal phosphate-dependent protein|nr:amino acid deaminase/aldolase [Solirubrobacteraceae bacterium]
MADDAYARLERATAGLRAPFALVDLDALSHNAADMRSRAAPKPIRLASKSLRCRALHQRVLDSDGFAGTLAFTLPEALWLFSHGLHDLLVAYPTADAHALSALVSPDSADQHGRLPAESITVMVDSVDTLELIERAVTLKGAPSGARAGGRTPPAPVRVCIDVDTSWRTLHGRVRLGARRSPLHAPLQVAQLAREVLNRPSMRLVGVMAYEAQIAGVGDAPAGRPARALAIRAMQALSARELAQRRQTIVKFVQATIASVDAPPLELVNGGGTGSLQRTAAETAVTEVAAGSGLYGPTLFDAYRAFKPRPAALFALPIVRRPAAGVVTVLGGGYLASGPGDAARLPTPHLPAGLRLDRQEGAGEVQTPLLGHPADSLALGQRVYFRHAKAGELCEHFNSLHLLEGDKIVQEVPTYRGEGQCFL